MTDNLFQEFVQCLIKETISGSRRWQPLQPPDEEENKNLYYALFESEWHHIKDGYTLSFMNGFVYLIGEWSESGRDGTTFDGYNLYIQPYPDKELTLVMNDTKEVYRLKNAIEEKLKPDESVTEFIKSFLNA